MPSLPTIPDHVLLRLIGQGAYGEVWLARNVMGTLRAVKVIWRRRFESVRPFDREFTGIQRYEPVSRSSGGLVHVLHVGRNDAEGYFYYVMELADNAKTEGAVPCEELGPAKTSSGLLHSTEQAGDTTLASRPVREPPVDYIPRTLRADLKRLGQLTTADCLRLAIDVASGLSQLHRQGLVHRDVKPGNIIYIGGRAKLADIGLVTAEGEGRTFVGTEGYIPPEGPGTPAADLYALGVVLYEASTGLPPERLPDIPPEWFTDPAGDDALELHEVILKASEGQRQNRYPSAEAMQADLALLQSGQSVRHMRALARRYTRLRAAGIAGTGLLVCALAAAFMANYRARLAAQSHARELALRLQLERSLQRTEAAEQARQEQLYTALLEQAHATVRSGELGQRVRTLEAIQRAGSISNSIELRRTAVAAMMLPDFRLQRRWPKGEPTTLVELAPTFEKVALGQGAGAIEIRLSTDGRLLARLGASTNLPAFNARWSPDGRFLAVKRDRTGAGDRADLEVWNIETTQRVLLLQDVDFGISAYHPSQERVLAGLRSGTVGVWDLQNGAELARFQLPGTPLLLRFSPTGERFAAVYPKSAHLFILSIHRMSDGRQLRQYEFADYVAGLDWDRNGHRIAIAEHGGGVHLVDPDAGESRILGHHKAQAVLAVFDPTGEYLLTGGWEQELICWDVRRRERAFTISLNSFLAQWRNDGRACAIFTDEAVQLFSFERPSGCRKLEEDLGPRLHSAAFSRDGRWLAASGSKQMGLWDLNGEHSGVVATEGGDTRLFFSPGGELFATRDDACFRWRLDSTEKLGPARLEPLNLPQQEGFNSLCLTTNKVVLTSSKGSCIVSLKEGEPTETRWASTVDGISGASADGHWLGIFAPFSRLLHVYRLPAMEQTAILTNSSSIARFEFSPLGDEIAVSCLKGVELWSTATWQPTRNLTNFISLLYAPGTKNLWLTKDLRTAGLYDAQSLKLLLPLPAGSRPLALSPDGGRLAVSADANQLQVWDLEKIRTGLRELGLDW